MRARHILVPIDFSEGSSEAFATAVTMARESGARLSLLHVLHVPMTTLPDVVMPDPEVRHSVERAVEHALVMMCDRARDEGVEVDWHTAVGSTSHEICALAESLDIDLIVIGTHGGGVLAHALLGSVAERVVRKALCPVLTVRPQVPSALHP
jgi:nucleotide-binding universal stress UspA family protein